jgi:hypothetical protein
MMPAGLSSHRNSPVSLTTPSPQAAMLGTSCRTVVEHWLNGRGHQQKTGPLGELERHIVDRNLRRWVALGGLLFVVLAIAAVALITSAPDNTASAAKVLSYYTQHKNSGYVTAFLLEAAVVVVLWFFWYMRNLLVDAGADARLTTLGFAGAIVFGVGGGIGGGMKWVMSDSVGHLTPATLQGLNAVGVDLGTVLSGAGSALLLFALSIAIIKSGALAKWLGWLGIVLGVVSLIAMIGPVPVAIWVLVASLVLAASTTQRAGIPATTT